MSYILKSTSPFISIKLTEIGRQNLAQGQLNFASYAIGDSEIEYEREAIVDANPNDPVLSATSMVLRPFDRQPDISSFITDSSGNHLTALNSSNINVIQAVVNNQAEERGFFTGSGQAYTSLTTSYYAKTVLSIANTAINGTNVLSVPLGSNVGVGDFIKIKLNNNTISPSQNENATPLPNLWFKVQSTATTSTLNLTLDRKLPNNSGQNSSNSYVFVYPNGEISDVFGYGTSTAYWDSGTLSFDSATNITCNDVKIWNMNNVWCENIAGITGLSSTNLYENFTKFGSYQYLGTKSPLLQYLCTTTGTSATFQCSGPGFSYPDDVTKAISIIHYSNNSISNLYGEFFYIDTLNNKTVRITMPDMMYHRSNYGTGSGSTMGMSFVASGSTYLLGNTTIEYLDLTEDPSLIGNRSPITVGKVLPQLKMIVIDDPEIIAAMSYKSNRNWTLPPLAAQLSSPTGGTSTGILAVNETMFVTYALDNASGTGLGATLPCQEYTVITNNSSTSKDVSFRISDVDLLPFMRKIELGGYDGKGFNAYKFKVLYQIVSDQNARPDAGNWKVYDFTSTLITGTGGQTINPKLLENQVPSVNNFVLTSIIDSAATIYDLTIPLGMALNSTPNTLQFGDERFFYGNLSTYIGASIYKTLFDIRVNSAQYTQTTNPTRSLLPSTNPPNIKVSEVGIYDNNNNLVVIGKLSQPVPLLAGQTITLELSMDF
jgi:hypothetical protein